MTVDATGRDEALCAILDATAAKLTDQPERAHIRFSASGTGGEGVRSHIRIGNHILLVDEPPALGGDNEAPNPVETALAALLSCQVVTYRVWAAKLGVPLDDIGIDVQGDLDVRGFYGFDDTVRPGFGDVRVTVTLSGPAEAAEYRRLATAVDAHCPVLDLFRSTTPVTTTLVTGQDATDV
ncbi:OsmC family protein [Pseudonocardia sp. TRM90224]|uniref:OsmC family protein n=1 Tax=Pseudonocardia sp. TRM90224 TaxID=2812678 RepID=UPI001E29261B|nr:OsmC family protein [Pseudonocardia sp. TRM90224]